MTLRLAPQKTGDCFSLNASPNKKSPQETCSCGDYLTYNLYVAVLFLRSRSFMTWLCHLFKNVAAEKPVSLKHAQYFLCRNGFAVLLMIAVFELNLLQLQFVYFAYNALRLFFVNSAIKSFVH